MGKQLTVLTVLVAAGAEMGWRLFSCHTLGPLLPIKHDLNVTVYLSIIAAHIYYSCNGYFQHNNAPCHKAQFIIQLPTQSPDLNPIQKFSKRFHHEYADDTCTVIIYCIHVNRDQNLS